MRLKASIFRNSVAVIAFFATSFVVIKAVEAAQPSFNCAKAKHADELAICSSDELSELDRQAADEFAAASSRGVSEKELNAARREVLSRRGACGSQTGCIRKSIREAIRIYSALGQREVAATEQEKSSRAASRATEDEQFDKSISMVEQGLVGGHYQFGGKQIGNTSRASFDRNGRLALYNEKGRMIAEVNVKNIKGAVGNLIVCDDISELCVDTPISRWGGIRLIPNDSMSVSEFMHYFAFAWSHMRNGD